MSARLFRSFSMEIMKLASDIPDDAAIRELLAFRRGEEYLPGGELQKNAVSSLTALQIGSGSPLSKSVHSKGPEKYQEGRDWAITGLKGATGGVGTLGLYNTLRHGPDTKLTLKGGRGAAAIGAGVALGDRILRRHAEKKHKALEKHAGIVSPSPERTVKTPSAMLRSAQQTGAIRSQAPKMVGRVFNGAVRLGKGFRVPTRLGVR